MHSFYSVYSGQEKAIKQNINTSQNYYQVLHVQPDAPAEVIRASYHTLMRDLKIHPDLGGNQSVAALLNEAYETLSNRLKRAEYDREYGISHVGPQWDIYQAGDCSAHRTDGALSHQGDQYIPAVSCRHFNEPAKSNIKGSLICRKCATELKRKRRKWWMRIFRSTKYYTCPVCHNSVLWLSGLIITI